MALATADAEGRPSVRHVLLKGYDGRGFVFYTNSDSLKGAHVAGCCWGSPSNDLADGTSFGRDCGVLSRAARFGFSLHPGLHKCGRFSCRPSPPLFPAAE